MAQPAGADALLPPLPERAFELVIVDPAEWSGYVLKPFDTVTGADSPARTVPGRSARHQHRLGDRSSG